MPEMPRHLFVTRRKLPLPRWGEAFPDLVLQRPDAGRAAVPAAVVWWELAGDGDVAAVAARAIGVAPAVPLVILAAVPDDDQALACLAAGARGYCNVHAQAAGLAAVAQVVRSGGLWLGESLVSRLIHAVATRVPRASEAPAAAVALTPREQEVARALAVGASNKRIATLLGITERTVKAHVSALLAKHGARDRLQLALKLARGAG